MSDRGDYRSFYSAFWDDPDVHSLSHAAYRVLTTLKGTFPASGIGVVYFTVLSERTGMTRAELEAAFQELEHPKPNADFGWIVRERNIVWIVNGLRFEPTLYSNNPLHRTFLRKRLLAPLGERTAIVGAFRRYYAEWFEDAVPSPDPDAVSVPSGTKAGTESEPSRNGLERVSKHNSNSSPSSNSSPITGLNAEEFGAREISDASTASEEPLTAVSLAVVVNAAIAERWGEQTRPKTPASAEEPLRELRDKGIDRETVVRSVYRQARALKGDKPPRTIAYFLPGIDEDWGAELARRQLAASGQKAPPDDRKSRANTATSPAKNGAKPHKMTPGEETYHNGREAFADLDAAHEGQS